jgi:hypothetical protein
MKDFKYHQFAIRLRWTAPPGQREDPRKVGDSVYLVSSLIIEDDLPFRKPDTALIALVN